MALTCGFFNALPNGNGTYDRTYNAEDYSDNLGAVISTGVLRDSNNGFRVYAADGNNGLVLGIRAGRAWIEGHWAKLDTNEILPAITPPVGDLARIDAVILQLDRQESVRNITLQYRTGTPAASPQAPTPTRNDQIYEIVLAHVRVNPSATSLTVTDTRANKNLCGWVSSPLGYDDYFENFDAVFNEWFEDKKNTLAVNTLFKEYTWRTVLTTERPYVDFNIPQYAADGVSIISVYINGLRQTEGVDYTLSGNRITFSTAGGGTGLKTAGTEVVVVCNKSVDGTGIGSVADEITELQNDVASLNTAHEYTYICNGVDDNVKLSQIASNWLNDSDYSSKVIRVLGTFGASAPYSGAGTEANPYIWLRLGAGGATNRKITFDFTGCSQISINCGTASYNVIFFGLNVNVIGANVIATGGSMINMFSTAAATVVNAERCRFWVTSENGLIARGGTFRDCRTSLTTTAANAQAFSVLNGGLLRIFGGEHYAYAPTDYVSSVFYVHSGQAGAVLMTYGANCPTVARSGYVQTNAINSLSNDASCSFTDTVTTLEISADGQNVRGTIKRNKAGLL